MSVIVSVGCLHVRPAGMSLFFAEGHFQKDSVGIQTFTIHPRNFCVGLFSVMHMRQMLARTILRPNLKREGRQPGVKPVSNFYPGWAFQLGTALGFRVEGFMFEGGRKTGFQFCKGKKS